jgi:hypothetical protein
MVGEWLYSSSSARLYAISMGYGSSRPHQWYGLAVGDCPRIWSIVKAGLETSSYWCVHLFTGQVCARLLIDPSVVFASWDAEEVRWNAIYVIFLLTLFPVWARR